MPKAKAKPANGRDKARGLYVQDCLPAGAIAARLGVAERTVERWKAEDAAAGRGWKAAREAARAARGAAEQDAQAYLTEVLAFQRAALEAVKLDQALTPQEKTRSAASLADSFSKTVNACAKAAPETTQLAIALDMLQRLARFASETHAEAAPALAECLEAFAVELARDAGGETHE
jgi:hypothetical protein